MCSALSVFIFSFPKKHIIAYILAQREIKSNGINRSLCADAPVNYSWGVAFCLSYCAKKRRGQAQNESE